mmetsp:Transcript_57301/g.91226  ORF Transcript_57301/g.91226 Transcript_57301/m.91226 type:complete len:171 (+) Transcript_57301:3-515(+)
MAEAKTEEGSNSTEQKPLVVNKHYQPEELVFTFSHAQQAAEAHDIQIKGHESANRYYHIATPIEQNSCVMYRYQLKGFAYGCAKPLDIIWCGYTYTNGAIVKPVNVDLHKIGFKVEQYINSNKRVCLKFGPINRYCNGFALYYSAHYHKVKQGLDVKQYSIKAVAEDGTL